LDAQPYPERLDHHFVVDPAKFDFYAMDCYRLLGVDTLATTCADEVIRVGTAPDGTERSPMRISEANSTLGVIAGRDGGIDQAVPYGRQALSGQRKSIPHLLMTSRELGTLINERAPRNPNARDYLDQLRELRNTTRK